ncbi:MAG: histidine kinase [Bacteroidota bacterium]
MKRMPGLVLFIYFLFAAVHYSFAATDTSYNTIPSSPIKSILLSHWQITGDLTPKDNLQDIPDSLWRPFVPSTANDRYSEGNWLFRTDLFIEDSAMSRIAWGLFPRNFISAFEIYWDGTKIAQNGIIGINANNETPGTFNYDVLLPIRLTTPGKHTIILRISSYHDYSRWKWFYGSLVIGPYTSELKNIFQNRYRAIFISGILFIPFLFNLFLYMARKGRTEHLLFSLICLIVILDFMTDQISVFTNVPTIYIHWEIYLYRIITVLSTILFPAFFIYMFSFPKKTMMLIVLIDLIVLLLFTSFWNILNIMSLTVLVVSSLILLWALLSKLEESIIIFVGIVLAWVAYFFDFAFVGLVTIMVICTSFSIARQFAKKEKAEREAQLRSTHLENELLKKNINPHFLLNSLTSIIVWLRKDPTSAIKLIEALADEFRMITQISALKQIPIQQEIDLCRSHLKIMNYRKGTDYQLVTVDIKEEESVPPMIFHTLIENGLVHGYENRSKGTFTLRRKINADGIQYIVSHDGESADSGKKDSTGLGMQYIKGRLEESYPHRWEFVSHKQADGWETTIEIRDK